MSSEMFSEKDEGAQSLTKNNCQSVYKDNTQTKSTIGQVQMGDESHQHQKEQKEILTKRLTDLSECLEIGNAKDVANLPAISELCALLRELAIQIGLRLDIDNHQTESNYSCLIKLFEKYRLSYCNIPLCYNILNRLVQVSSRIDVCISHAELLKEFGDFLVTLGSYDEAIATAKKLSTMARKLGDKKLEAGAYYILVKVNVVKGCLRGAQCNLEKYLECSAESGDELCKAYAAKASSFVLFLEQKYDEAVKKEEEFLGLARGLRNKRAECEALSQLATIHCHRFHLQKGLDFYSNALEIAMEQQYTKMVTDIEVNQASMYSIIGDYNQAYNINKRLKERIGYENKAVLCTVISNLSVNALILKQKEEALSLAKEALAIAQSTDTAKLVSLAYGNIGLAEEKIGKFSDAIENFLKCLELGEQLNDDRIINQSYCNLGRAYKGMGDKRTARAYYEKALAIAQLPSTHWCDTKDFRFSADYLLAKMAFEENNLPEAKQFLVKVVDRCESFRMSVQDSPLKITFNDTQKKPYQYLQHVLLEENANEDALLIAEKGRGRDFYDKVVRDESKESQALNTPEALLHLAKTNGQAVLLLSRLKVINKMCGWFITPDGNIVKVFRLLLDQLERTLTSLCCAMFQLRDSKEDQSRPMEVRGIRSRKRVDTSKSVSLETGIPSTKPSPDCSKLDQLRSPGSSAKQERGRLLCDFSKIVDDLSELIIQPIENHLEELVEEHEQKPQLLIIPQGMTFNIPYAALRLKGEPLCSLVSPCEAFSFHSYSYSAKPDRDCEPHDTEEILVVGNPTNDLPFAEEEAKAIAKQLGVTPLIRSSATHGEVVSRLPHASIVHFACHGEEDGKSLWLAPEKTSVTNEKSAYSSLTVRDVSVTTTNARLVVLSACHTARGTLSSEGVLGLARAFLMSGAKSVITALWGIHDDATKTFMELLYKNLLEKPVADALSTTMCQLRKNKSFQHVVHWGSFKVLGANVKVLSTS